MSPPLFTCTYVSFTFVKHLKIEVVINMILMFNLNKYRKVGVKAI